MQFLFGDLQDGISMEDARAYIAYIYDATNFTIDFIAQFREFESRNITFQIWYGEGNLVFGGGGGLMAIDRVVLFNLLSVMVAGHEVVHAVMHQIGEPRPIRPLEEGFADFINDTFNKSEDFDHSLPYHDEIYGEGFIRHAYSFYYDYLWHFAAHYRLTNHDYRAIHVGFGTFYTSVSAPDHIAAINTYATATSFVIYLVETYGMDNFMKVLWDVDNFINVYGQDIHGMIEEWRRFLYNFVSSNEYAEEWEELAISYWNQR